MTIKAECRYLEVCYGNVISSARSNTCSERERGKREGGEFKGQNPAYWSFKLSFNFSKETIPQINMLLNENTFFSHDKT